MAHYQDQYQAGSYKDEYGNPIRPTDEYGYPIQQTGTPGTGTYGTGGAYAGAPESGTDFGVGHDKDRHGVSGMLHRSGSSSSSSVSS